MNIEDRITLNKQKLNGIQARLGQIEQEKQELLQEALRTDGELRILNEQVADKVKKKGD
ncbi:MAG: hypothetical protein MUP81_00220 [Dehalococcoidia bacterium]|nr:hypothetical protein [Dehalococcoidia bacterium]